MKHGLSRKTYEQIKKVIDKYFKYKIVLFGSRAREDYKETSDTDLAVLSEIARED